MTENKTAPEVPHADLIAEARARVTMTGSRVDARLLYRLVDALAALGDTVPREQYDLSVLELSRQISNTRDERDALAHFREQVRHIMASGHGDIRHAVADLQEAAATAPAVSLALHDAEVWDEGVRAKSASSSIFDADVFAQNPYRAAVIREEAK